MGTVSDAAEDRFIVDLEGFSGPLELLLELARRERVDLARLSMQRLADQYLAYLEVQARRRLHIAAEYLVMAAWLLQLKSARLLPSETGTAAEGETALRERLVALSRIQRLAAWLAARPRLGARRFPRGMPEEGPVVVSRRLELGLAELVSACARLSGRSTAQVLPFPGLARPTLAEVMERITGRLGAGWRRLEELVADGGGQGSLRLLLALGFFASLELARRGEVELRQLQPFGAVLLRRR